MTEISFKDYTTLYKLHSLVEYTIYLICNGQVNTGFICLSRVFTSIDQRWSTVLQDKVTNSVKQLKIDGENLYLGVLLQYANHQAENKTDIYHTCELRFVRIHVIKSSEPLIILVFISPFLFGILQKKSRLNWLNDVI